MKNSPIPSRIFGGKVKDFSSKEEEKKEKKHLNAYLSGKKQYKHEGYMHNVITIEHR